MRQEKYGFRDDSYSRWHRAIPLELDFIDIDWQEVCATCHTTVLLYELARDTGQTDKPAFSTQKLGRRASIPTYCVLYQVEGRAIVGFRIRQLWPRQDDGFRAVTTDEWVAILRRARCHEVQATPESERTPTSIAPRCASCGSAPAGTFNDGSPRYTCDHAPLFPLAAGAEDLF